MWTRLLLGLLFLVQASSLSVIPDEKQRSTVADDGTITSSGRNVETLKQLVNQETIIRMALERKVYDLLRDMADLKTEMESKNKQLQEEVRALRHENSLMRTDHEDLSNVTTLHFGDMADLKTTMESKNKQLQEEVRALRHENSLTRTDHEDESNVTTLPSAESSEKVHVAFTATVIRGITSQHGQTLVFPHVITNIGGGYNGSSGVFTAPRDGVYVFFCKMTTADKSGVMYFEFILNWTIKTRNLVYGTSTNPFRTSSNSIVLQLRHGDRVWVNMYRGGKHWSSGAGGDQSFSGYLL